MNACSAPWICFYEQYRCGVAFDDSDVPWKPHKKAHFFGPIFVFQSGDATSARFRGMKRNWKHKTPSSAAWYLKSSDMKTQLQMFDVLASRVCLYFFLNRNFIHFSPDSPKFNAALQYWRNNCSLPHFWGSNLGGDFFAEFLGWFCALCRIAKPDTCVSVAVCLSISLPAPEKLWKLCARRILRGRCEPNQVPLTKSHNLWEVSCLVRLRLSTSVFQICYCPKVCGEKDHRGRPWLESCEVSAK